MRSPLHAAVASLAAASFVLALPQQPQPQAPPLARYVNLQSSSPGAAQTGHVNVTGVVTSGQGRLDDSTNFGVTLYSRATGHGALGVWGESEDGVGLYASSNTSTAMYAYGNSGVGAYGYSNSNYGVAGSSSSTDAVYGISYGSGAGVHGDSSGSNDGVLGTSFSGVGVRGTGASRGVVGQSPGSIGVSGEGPFGGIGVLASSTNGGWGLYADTSGGGYGIVSNDDVLVGGNLIVYGSKTGYVVDIVKNAGNEPLECGDVVEIAGAEAPLIGEIPLILVRKATSARANAVLGPISTALGVEPNDLQPAVHTEAAAVPTTAIRWNIHDRAGSVQPGEHAHVVTLGAFRAIKVDARYGAIRAGDPLVASPNPGYAMSATDPRPTTVIGKALGELASGTGKIAVMVSGR